ncbi:hypothetical protein KQP56_18275 [Bacteroides thetaiotaomicron]|uniref:hypothetical protein n=1 Tax=Bacteroides thetaiotaomicron TaxID=818 RepID=UPI002222DAC1|nr:hypothetical protein [Bacteroides thetaiotaomicron]UYU94567.1 hypothetical protein KQP56_18275 [Bacteroides thetaiotaomicron]
MVKINGSSFALQYKRTTGRPIDSTATFKTLEDATSYARNTDAEEYFPYPAQIVSVESDGSVYKLLKDETISEADGRKHYKLSPIMTGDDADDKYLSKVEDDSAKGLITFLAGIDVKIKAVVQKLIAEDATFSKEISSKDYVQNLIGWMISPDGHIDAKSLHLRDFLEVPELRYNRVSITSGEDWLAPGGGIIESVNESSQTLTLKLEPGEVASLAVDDICKGIFNNSTGFQTSYFRITQKISNSEFKYTLRSGYSYHPQKAMHFVAYGNFTNAERQKSAYSTKDYKRYLAGVNNWEITSSMVMMQLGDLSNLVISGLDLSGYSAYLRNVYMTGTIKQLSQDGTTEVLVPAFKGEWKAGKYWYYDEVTHNGSTWICIEPSTTQEPSDSSTDWLKVVSEGRPGDNGTSLVFKGEFASAPSNPQNGWYYRNTTDKKCYVYQDGAWHLMTEDGKPGDDGVGIKDVDVLFYLSSSATSLVGGSWSTTSPTWVNGKYIWSKTRVIYTNTTTWESDPACISGGKGENGLGIKSVIEEYYLSTSSSSLIGGSWSTSAPAWVNGKYIWTRSVITYTDGSSTTTDAICVTGAKGETGIGVKSYREQYYLSTSYSTPAGGSWSYNVPNWTDGKFMWTRTVVTYTDNTTWTSDPVCVTGSAGPSGKGVKSFEVFYYLSTSSSSLVGGSWSTTAPKWEDGKYIWTKTKVTYTDNTTYESDPVCLTGGQGKTGLPGAMLRPRGEWKPNTEYYHNDAFIDTVIYNGNNKLCKVTHTSTSTFDSTKWDEFNEFINVATNVLLAQNATIDVLGTSGIFVGNLEKTQGWLLTEGAIRHNQTSVELTNDGRISLPETGGMIVGGKTFIEAGKIKTEFIDVDNLKVKHLDGATGTFKELQAVDINGKVQGKISFSTTGAGEDVESSLNINFLRTWISGDLYQQGYNSTDKRSWRFYTSDLWCRGEFGHSKMTTMEYYGYDTGEVYFHTYGMGNAGVRHVYPKDNGQPVDCIILSGNTNYIACVCDASPQKMIVLVNNSDYTKRISVNYASQAKAEISPWSFKIFITGAMQSGVNNLFGMG